MVWSLHHARLQKLSWIDKATRGNSRMMGAHSVYLVVLLAPDIDIEWVPFLLLANEVLSRINLAIAAARSASMG